MKKINVKDEERTIRSITGAEIIGEKRVPFSEVKSIPGVYRLGQKYLIRSAGVVVAKDKSIYYVNDGWISEWIDQKDSILVWKTSMEVPNW